MRILIVLPLALLFGCQPSKKEDKADLKALKNEVVDIHNEVMSKMGDLRRVGKSMMLQADSLRATDSLRADELAKISNQLASAREGMMAWMRNFDPDFEYTYEETLNYLNRQKEGITKVREDMLTSLQAGEEALKSKPLTTK